MIGIQYMDRLINRLPMERSATSKQKRGIQVRHGRKQRKSGSYPRTDRKGNASKLRAEREKCYDA